MADPERPHDDPEYDDERFEDEGRRSIFSALWFRAILVVIVLGVVAAVAVPYVLELANQPPPKSTALVKPESPPPPAPVAPPTPPVASAPAPAPEKPPAAEKPPAVEKPSAAEKPASTPTPMTPAEKPAVVAKKSDASKSAAAAKEQAAPRPAKGPSPSGAYFVQVGAFKNHETAKQLAVRLREMKYNVEESSTSVIRSARAAAASPSASAAPAPSGSDRYDVYVTGAAAAEINAKLTAKGLTAEPSGGGVIVKPSLPLRDAVALSKDLAVDGLKVQVRRGGGAPAPAPPPSGGGATATSDGTVYRVRVGPFDDRTAATSTLRELEQRGYTPFIARGGQ